MKGQCDRDPPSLPGTPCRLLRACDMMYCCHAQTVSAKWKSGVVCLCVCECMCLWRACKVRWLCDRGVWVFLGVFLLVLGCLNSTSWLTFRSVWWHYGYHSKPHISITGSGLDLQRKPRPDRLRLGFHWARSPCFWPQLIACGAIWHEMYGPPLRNTSTLKTDENLWSISK